MKNGAGLVIGLFVLLGGACGTSAAETIIGNWKGVLEIGQLKLRLVYKIQKTPEGLLFGYMDSLDQGVRDMKIDKIVQKDGKVQFQIALLQGIFEGMLDSSGEKIVGQWRQGGETTPLTLTRIKGTITESPTETLTPADAAANKKAAEKLAGDWNGTLTNAGATYELALKIRKATDGAAMGTMDSPSLGLSTIPLSAITYKDGNVRFEARGLGAFYEGVSFNDATWVTGKWHQASQIVPLSFRKAAGAK